MTITAELLYDDSWQEVQAYEQEGWKYKIGPSDITGLEPNSLEITLANDDLSMDPSNVLSPLYGKIGPNTPVRLVDYTPGSQTAADTFDGRTVASGWGTSSGGQVWTTSGGSAADYSVSSGLGRMSLTSINTSRRATLPGVVTGGDALMLWTIDIDPTGDDIETTFMIHYQDASNYVQASIYWDRDGRPIELQFVRRQAGVVTQLGISHLTVSPTGAAFSCWMRVQWFGINMRMKVWPAASAQPANWSLSALETVWSSGQVGVRANLQPLFSAGTPRLVTLDQFSLSAFSGRVMAVGEASSWRPETTSEHVPGVRGRSWVGVTADGIQRRLGRWDQPSESPLRRQISSYGNTLLGYWSLEDAAGAQDLSNSVTATQAYTGGPGYFSDEGVTLADDEGPAGSLAALTIEQGAAMGGRFIFDATSDGYQISLLMKLDALPGAGAYIAFFQWSDTMGRMWYWRTNNNSFEIGAYDEFGTLISAITPAWGAGVDPTTWTRYRIKVSVSGSTVSYNAGWYPQDALSIYSLGGSFTNVSVGYPIAWRVVGNAYNNGAAYNHIFGVSDLSLDLLGAYDAVYAFNAYSGESASSRYTRLMKENGVTYTWRGEAQAAIMGRQPRGTLMELLEEIQITEGAVIYDDPSQLRLTMRVNNHLLNQTPVLALTKGVDLGYPLKKAIDDQRAANDITVTNWDGSTAQVTKTTGPRGVAAPPSGVGRYPGRLEVNFRYAQSLTQRGNWELANNTLDRPRYPVVVVDLLANPGLKASVTALRPGDLITITGEEPSSIPLMVIQIERAGNNVKDTATLSCIPADLYLAGKYDDGVIRYDSRTTTLAGVVSTTGTFLSLKMETPDDRWKAGAGGWDIMINGERMTVTNVTAGSASGTGWTQVMTVTRSVNGAVRSHAIGEQVHVATPGRYVMKNREPQQ